MAITLHAADIAALDERLAGDEREFETRGRPELPVSARRLRELLCDADWVEAHRGMAVAQTSSAWIASRCAH